MNSSTPLSIQEKTALLKLWKGGLLNKESAVAKKLLGRKLIDSDGELTFLGIEEAQNYTNCIIQNRGADADGAYRVASEARQPKIQNENISDLIESATKYPEAVLISGIAYAIGKLLKETK